jgi:HD-like signal output (HDOD) protein
MGLLGSESVDLPKVEALLSGEPALVAALLRRANCSAFGARVEIGTVREAIMRLGAPAALSVLVEVCMRGRRQPPQPIYGVPNGVRWQLSIIASLVARELYGQDPRRFRSTVVTAALLHDVGRIPLGAVAGTAAMTAVLEHQTANACSLAEAERAVLGLDGCTAGALVAADWEFPEALVEALGGWDDPEVAQAPMTDAVHVSAVLARMVAAASGIVVRPIRPCPTAARRLGLDKAGIGAIAARVTEHYAEVALEAAPAKIEVEAKPKRRGARG